MSEEKRIKEDYEHFLSTGDDYPHLQRAHDKKVSQKLFSAAIWCFCVAFAVFVWSVVL